MRMLILFAAMALVAEGAPALAQGPLNPGVVVENHGGSDIRELRIKPDGAGVWGENKLGASLAPGKSASFREATETNCKYRIAAVYEDGRREEQPVDVCRHQRVVFGSGDKD